MKNFSQNLKEMCIDKGIKLFDLAKLSGIDNGTIYKYANDISLPTIKNLIKLANYFECSLDYLLGLTDNYVKSPIKFENISNLFYKRYLNLLKEKNITNYALTKQLKIAESSIQNWEKGSVPYIPTLIKMADYFCVSVDYLIGRIDEK